MTTPEPKKGLLGEKNALIFVSKWSEKTKISNGDVAFDIAFKQELSLSKSFHHFSDLHDLNCSTTLHSITVIFKIGHIGATQ